MKAPGAKKCTRGKNLSQPGLQADFRSAGGGGFDATPFGITPALQRPASGQACLQAFARPMLPPRRYSRGPLRTTVAECGSLLLRLGTPTISVRQTAGNPAMPHTAPTATKPRGNPNRAVAAGLRAPANRPPQEAPTPGPTVPFKPSRIDPLNREPRACPNADPRPVHRINEPVMSATPGDASHTRSQRRRQENPCRR
jgi:hypothetical protein